MSKQKWQQRYADASLPTSPCWLLEAYRALLPEGGHALDLACGLGGNALLLASAGLSVDAVDYADNAIAKLNDYAQAEQLAICGYQRDLERDGLDSSTYDVIVVSYYLHRPLLTELGRALRPGGLLFYQTFNSTRQAENGPSNPDFLLSRGELTAAYPDFEVLVHREDLEARGPGYPRQTAFVGRKPGVTR